MTRRVAYTTTEVAELLLISPSTVRNMVRDGRLQRIPHTGRTVRIARSEVETVFGVRIEDDAA